MGPPGPNLDALSLLLQEAYLEHDTIASATQFLVHQLFEEYGLLVLDPDTPALKKAFIPVMADELTGEGSLMAVKQGAERLGEHYKVQAFARPVNLFYLTDGLRERIEKKEDRWVVLQTSLSWNKEELLQELNDHPERFSPNVILRPLFQETILPDVAFIGGGSELAYWLQLKPLFEAKNIFFPVILLRQSVLLLPEKAVSLQQELGFSNEDLFLSQPEQEALYLEKEGRLCPTEAEREAIKKAMLSLQAKAAAIAPQLVYSAGAALAKMQHQLNVLEQKMRRAEKKKAGIAMNRIAKLRESVFPMGTLQERKENFLSYYLRYGPEFIAQLHQHTDPLSASFLLLSSQNPDS